MIDIKLFDIGKIGELKLILRKYKFRPFCKYSIINPQQQIEYFSKWLNKDVKNKKYRALIGYENRIPICYSSLNYLGWESNNYGLKMGRLDFIADANFEKSKIVISKMLKSILKQAHKEQFKHLVCKFNPEQIYVVNILENMGFYLTACTTTYYLGLNERKHPVQQSEYRIRQYKKSDELILKKLSYMAFGDKDVYLDRFHADFNLSLQKSNLLYMKWFENCVKGERADIVFVAEAVKPIGYIACRLNKLANETFNVKFGHIELNAIAPEFRRKGIYTSLINKALEWFKDKGVNIATITTQLNAYGIHRTWHKLGARIDSTNLVLHKYKP